MNPKNLILTGLAVMLLGVVASTVLARSEALQLAKDKDVGSLGYTFRYVGSRPVEGETRDAHDVVVRSGGARFVLSPTLDYSNPAAGTRASSVSHSLLTRDLCLTPVEATGESVTSRLNPRLVLRENETSEVLGLTVTFLGFTTREPGAASDREPEAGSQADAEEVVTTEITAGIRVRMGDVTHDLAPTARTRPGGIDPGPPVSLPGTAWTLVLDGVDATNGRVRLDIITNPADTVPPPGDTLWVEASNKPLANLIRPGAALFLMGAVWAGLGRVRRLRDVSTHS